jgi:hypothetical protein
VALDAIDGSPLKPGVIGLAVVDEVEDGSLPGIEGNKLKELPVMDLPDVNVVIEVKSAGS